VARSFAVVGADARGWHRSCGFGRSNFRDMYWTMAQMLTHHASNGCNLRPGDLLASGTVSGAGKTRADACWNSPRGQGSSHAADGEQRKFLEDGDEVIPPRLLRARRIPPHRAGQLPGDDSARVRDLTRPCSPLPSTIRRFLLRRSRREALHRGKKEELERHRDASVRKTMRSASTPPVPSLTKDGHGPAVLAGFLGWTLVRSIS